MKQISNWTKVIAVSLAILFCATPAIAQDAAPAKRPDVEYVRVNYVAYKPDQRNEARRIIEDHFIPASQTAGTPGPTLTLHFQTGEWDAIFIWAMEEGTEELEWTQITPNWVKWKAALDAQVGGEEEGSELLQRYTSTISHRKTEIAHHHVASD